MVIAKSDSDLPVVVEQPLPIVTAEDCLHQMEERLDQLEKKQDQQWESYKRLLNGIMRALGGDIEERGEG